MTMNDQNIETLDYDDLATVCGGYYPSTFGLGQQLPGFYPKQTFDEEHCVAEVYHEGSCVAAGLPASPVAP